MPAKPLTEAEERDFWARTYVFSTREREGKLLSELLCELPSVKATLDAARAERDEAGAGWEEAEKRSAVAESEWYAVKSERDAAIARAEKAEADLFDRTKECEEWSRADNGQQTWDYEAAAEARRLRAEREAKRG